MESRLTPPRTTPCPDRLSPERTVDSPRPSSSGEYHGEGNSCSSVLPAQGAAPIIEGAEMSVKSAEDISEKIRQDGVRHLLTGRAAGNFPEYGDGGSAFVRSLIVGAGNVRTNDVP